MRKVIIYGVASVLNATLSTLGYTLEDFIIPWWIISAMWTALIVASIYEWGPEIRARLRAGKHRGGPTAKANLSARDPYDVIQYWNQSVLDALLKVPRYPKIVRMRDTGEIMEWNHPTPEHLKSRRD